MNTGFSFVFGEHYRCNYRLLQHIMYIRQHPCRMYMDFPRPKKHATGIFFTSALQRPASSNPFSFSAIKKNPQPEGWGLFYVFGEHYRCTSFFSNSGLRDYPANCRLLQTWNRDRGNPRNAPEDSISGHNPYGDTWVSLESADSVQLQIHW